VLEAQPLHRVSQLDIDAEIVGIELQLGAGEEAARRVDVERQPGDRAKSTCMRPSIADQKVARLTSM
jgi:hypothetical protein